MKKIMSILVIALLLIATVSVVFASGKQPDRVRVFIEFKGKPDTNVVNENNGVLLHRYDILDNVLAVELPVNALDGVLRNPNVVGVEFDAELASAAGVTGLGVTVCVIDTGVDKDHQDLQANIAGGRNFVAKGATVDQSKIGR